MKEKILLKFSSATNFKIKNVMGSAYPFFSFEGVHLTYIKSKIRNPNKLWQENASPNTCTLYYCKENTSYLEHLQECPKYTAKNQFGNKRKNTSSNRCQN